MLYNPFQKTEEVEILANSFYEINITLTLKPDKDSNFKKKEKKKQMHRPISLINLDIKILNKI